MSLSVILVHVQVMYRWTISNIVSVPGILCLMFPSAFGDFQEGKTPFSVFT